MEKAPQIYPWPEGLKKIPAGHPYIPIYGGEGKIIGVRNLTEREIDMTCNEQMSVQWRRRPNEWASEDCCDDEL